MRYRLLASYQGAPYEAGVGPTESDVVLFAACPPPEDLRFEPATGHWRKQVHLADVQTLHESRPVGFFRGERCIVLDDLTDRLHIAYLGHDAYRAEQLGYWEVDRGVFELIAPRQEVTDVVEQRLAFPHSADGTWQTAAAYTASEPATGYPAESGNGVGTGPRTTSYPGQSRDGFATGPQIAYGGPDTPGNVPPAPGGTDLEPGSPAVAAGYSHEPPPADFSEGDRGQALPVTGFGGSPDAGQASEGFAPAANLGASSEPDSAADLVATPSYLTATAVPGVAMPMIDEPPLPLEAQALRATTAAHRREQPETPAEQIPAEHIPAEQTPAERIPAEHIPAEQIPAEQIPAEHIPTEQIPAEQIPAEQPAQNAPTAAIAPAQDTPQAITGPVQDGPAVTVQPVQSSPAGHIPVPVGDVPASGMPASGMPVSEAPASEIAAGAEEPLAPARPISAEQAALQPPEDEADSQLATVPRRRRAAKRRLPTQRIFSDLARQAAIPATAYAVGEDVDGAMCLMRTVDGFEVFNSAAGARHEVRIFQDEESAYFYLFGVLVAEAVRTGALAPHQ